MQLHKKPHHSPSNDLRITAGIHHVKSCFCSELSLVTPNAHLQTEMLQLSYEYGGGEAWHLSKGWNVWQRLNTSRTLLHFLCMCVCVRNVAVYIYIYKIFLKFTAVYIKKCAQSVQQWGDCTKYIFSFWFDYMGMDLEYPTNSICKVVSRCCNSANSLLCSNLSLNCIIIHL
jgi:hypothetical protein